MDTLELINRRRRQLHVHSVIYYVLNTSIIPDALFDSWANELAGLQQGNPKLKRQGYMPELFSDWTGDTGMHLRPSPRILSLAEWLIEEAQNRDAVEVSGWQGDVGYKTK